MNTKKPRPTAYHRGQHDLICDALQIPKDPKAPGLTAYEAVCVLRMKLNVAQDALSKKSTPNARKQALSYLRRKAGSFDMIRMY